MASTLIHQPALDYLTATSFDEKFFKLVKQDTVPGLIKQFNLNRLPVDGHVLQYRGNHYEDQSKKLVLFVGQGMQRKEQHFLFRASGVLADTAYRKLLSSNIDFNIARADAQITCPYTCTETPISSQLWKLFHDGQLKEEAYKGLARRKVVVVLDGEHANTLYIGSRKSDKFIRVYQKTIGEDTDQVSGQTKLSEAKQTTHFVRLEVEIKARSAKTFHQYALQTGPDFAIYRILRWAERGMYETPLVEAHRAIIRQFPEQEKWQEGKIATLPSETAAWWLRACVGTAEYMLDCLEIREDFMRAMQRIIRLIEQRGLLEDLVKRIPTLKVVNPTKKRGRPRKEKDQRPSPFENWY